MAQCNNPFTHCYIAEGDSSDFTNLSSVLIFEKEPTPTDVILAHRYLMIQSQQNTGSSTSVATQCYEQQIHGGISSKKQLVMKIANMIISSDSYKEEVRRMGISCSGNKVVILSREEAIKWM